MKFIIILFLFPLSCSFNNSDIDKSITEKYKIQLRSDLIVYTDVEYTVIEREPIRQDFITYYNVYIHEKNKINPDDIYVNISFHEINSNEIRDTSNLINYLATDPHFNDSTLINIKLNRNYYVGKTRFYKVSYKNKLTYLIGFYNNYEIEMHFVNDNGDQKLKSIKEFKNQ